MISLMPCGHGDVSQLLRRPRRQSVFVGADDDLMDNREYGQD
jgi:hypothetical protein